MTWSTRPSKFSVVIEENTANHRRDIALHALRGVVLKTPVDTGRARGSWQVSGGAPLASPAGIRDQNQSLALGQSKVAALMRDLDTTIFINSNLPYINKLERGFSPQAPQGMVAVTVAEIRVRYTL